MENKFTPMQSILSNGVINLLSIVGGIVGLATVGISSSATTYVMVFVAGNFIYIASDIWRHLFKAGWLSNIFQFLFFCIGVGAMYGIKIYEQAQGAH